jgi:hypothetical protein
MLPLEKPTEYSGLEAHWAAFRQDVAVHGLYRQELNVLLLKHGVQAETATEHVAAIVATDTKERKADTIIPERFQQCPDVYTLYVRPEYFLAVVLNVTDVKAAIVMLTDLT